MQLFTILTLAVLCTVLCTHSDTIAAPDSKTEISLKAANDFHLRLSRALSKFNCAARFEGPLGYSGRALFMVNFEPNSNLWVIYAQRHSPMDEEQAVLLRVALDLDTGNPKAYPVQLGGAKYAVHIQPYAAADEAVQLNGESVIVAEFMRILNDEK